MYTQRYLAPYNLDTGLVDTTFRPTFDGGVPRSRHRPTARSCTWPVVQHRQRRHQAQVRLAQPDHRRPGGGLHGHGNGAGTELEATNTTVYVGGKFTTINGRPQRPGRGQRHDRRRDRRRTFNNDITGGIGPDGLLNVQELMLSPDRQQPARRPHRTADRRSGPVRRRHDQHPDPARCCRGAPGCGRTTSRSSAASSVSTPATSPRTTSTSSSPAAPAATGRRSTTRPWRSRSAAAKTSEPHWVSRAFDSVYSVAIAEVGRLHRRPLQLDGVADRQGSVAGPGQRGLRHGQGLSGYGLGDEVVRRDHIGVIDPATARRSSGSPVELLRGQQGDDRHPSWCGHRWGRHDPGRIERRPDRGLRLRQPPAAGANETTITSPIEGRIEEAGVPFTIDGHGSRHQRRQPGPARDPGAGVQPVPAGQPDDLGCGEHDQRQPAKPNATTTTWSLPVTISETGCWLLARTSGTTAPTTRPRPARSSRRSASRTGAERQYHGPVGDRAVDDVQRDRHGDGRHRCACDQLSIQEDENRYLQDNGTARQYNAFSITPDVVDASRTWSEVTVPTRVSGGVGDPRRHAGQSSLAEAPRLHGHRHRNRAHGHDHGTRGDDPADAAFPLTSTPGSPMTFRAPPRTTRTSPTWRSTSATTPRGRRWLRTAPGRRQPGRMVPDRADQRQRGHTQLVVDHAVQPRPGHLLLLGAGHGRPELSTSRTNQGG